MKCPQCGVDYSQGSLKVTEGTNRTTVGPLPHFQENYQISGKLCRHCGFVAEMIKHPTGNHFYLRKEVSDPKMLYSNYDFWNFLLANNLIEKFKAHVACEKGTRETKSVV